MSFSWFFRSKRSDKVGSSQLSKAFLILVSLCSPTLAFVGGWIAPQFQPGWTNGHGDLRLAVAVILTFLAAIAGYFSTTFRADKYVEERLEKATKGLFDAGLILNDFSSTDASDLESKQVRQELANTLARAVSYGGRQARVVVFFTERGEDVVSDGDGSETGFMHKNRFFMLDCHGGRADHPVTSTWDKTTEAGTFFCEQMISGQQTVVMNVKRPPQEAKLSVSESSQYGSFILTPIRDSNHFVRGAISIDYPGKSNFDSFDTKVAWMVANLFRDTFAASVKSAKEIRVERNDLLEKLEEEGLKR